MAAPSSAYTRDEQRARNEAATHAVIPNPTLPADCSTTPGDVKKPLPTIVPTSKLQELHHNWRNSVSDRYHSAIDPCFFIELANVRIPIQFANCQLNENSVSKLKNLK